MILDVDEDAIEEDVLVATKGQSDATRRQVD